MLSGAGGEAARVERATSAAARVLIALIALARPLVWSGEPTDLPNLFVLALLAALAACGALHRACTPPAARVSWPTALGAAFIAIAAIGCWRSPFAADAWATWSAWALHLGAVALAAPLIARHRRWALAGLLGGLACECLLIAAEQFWERPAVLERFAADPNLVEERMRGAFHERAANWRLTGSFLLANTLASYLIALLPTVVVCAKRARGIDAAWLWSLAVAAATALAMTGSKAGILAFAVACALTAAAFAPRRVAAWSSLGATLLVAIALATPAVRARLMASAGVRLDYWRGALALIRERPWIGHGIDGFRLGYARVKMPGADYTVIAHDEPLQAAVDLGIGAAVLLVAWWIAALARLRPSRARHQAPRSAAVVDDGAARGALGTLIVVGALACYAAVAVGALGDRAREWPGGAWAMLPLGGLAIAILARAPRLPAPPRAAIWCGVLACLLHALVDFHLHSAQVVGVLALLAALGERSDATDGAVAAAASSPSSASHAPSAPTGHGVQRVRAGWALVAMAVLLPSTAGICWTAWRGQTRERVRLAAAALQREDAAQPDELATDALASALAAYALPPTTAPEELARVAADDALHEATLWPEDPAAAAAIVALAAHASRLAPARAATWEPTLDALVRRWPDHLVFAGAWAEHARLRARRDPAWWPRALDAWRAVVALAPTHLPSRATLAETAERAGDADEARSQREAITELAPKVHPDDALPDQPSDAGR